mmetsp:Transcript_153200/g.293409  ORF Transcript_153200/g.293409 Transcript_153200/m.293409 type:complete len:253 (+) Transcript_153200:269-1027(+)
MVLSQRCQRNLIGRMLRHCVHHRNNCRRAMECHGQIDYRIRTTEGGLCTDLHKMLHLQQSCSQRAMLHWWHLKLNLHWWRAIPISKTLGRWHCGEKGAGKRVQFCITMALRYEMYAFLQFHIYVSHLRSGGILKLDDDHYGLVGTEGILLKMSAQRHITLGDAATTVYSFSVKEYCWSNWVWNMCHQVKERAMHQVMLKNVGSVQLHFDAVKHSRIVVARHQAARHEAGMKHELKRKLIETWRYHFLREVCY